MSGRLRAVTTRSHREIALRTIYGVVPGITNVVHVAQKFESPSAVERESVAGRRLEGAMGGIVPRFCLTDPGRGPTEGPGREGTSALAGTMDFAAGS